MYGIVKINCSVKVLSYTCLFDYTKYRSYYFRNNTIIELVDLMVTESLLPLLYGCLAIHLIIIIVEILLISIHRE